MNVYRMFPSLDKYTQRTVPQKSSLEHSAINVVFFSGGGGGGVVQRGTPVRGRGA